MTVKSLPLYPSSRVQSSLSPSQLASLNQKISLALQETHSLTPSRRDTPETVAFISSYARDAAQNILQSIIWAAGTSSSTKQSKSRDMKAIHSRVLLLVERVDSGLLDMQTIFDLTIAYSTHPARLRAILAKAFDSSATLLQTLTTSALPALTAVFQPASSSGLYGLRKTSHSLLCFFRVSPPPVLLAFARHKPFLLALANAYDAGLGSLAQSYGGFRLDSAGSAAPSRELDDWERILLETKVALIDAFHILFKCILEDLSRSQGPALASASEQTFDIFFTLLEIPTPPRNTNTPSTPFYNRPLLVDYQNAYDLSHLLQKTLGNAAIDDARVEFITTSLRSLDASSSSDSDRDPGVLKLLLGSGAPSGIDVRGKGTSRKIRNSATGSTPVAAPPPSVDQDDVEQHVSEVLSILPDHPRAYIRGLLLLPESDTVERVIQALLEGTAPPQEQVERSAVLRGPVGPPGEIEFTKERLNVFDDEAMDLSSVRIGKKTENTAAVLRDRTFIEQMKADILRRAEEVSDSEEEAVVDILHTGDKGKGKSQGKGKGVDIAFDEALEIDTVRVGGDGEESDEDEADNESDEARAAQIETILELAYISNPAVFDRDMKTRRSQGRRTLQAQTGWADEQIEGWKIMLERNPKQKEKMLQKHEFSGNKPLSAPTSTGPSRTQTPDNGQPSQGRNERGRGGGRGTRGRGRGGGGRGGGRGGGGPGSEQRDRAWKDKNKASRANHDRKRGHDRKMARGGGPPS